MSSAFAEDYCPDRSTPYPTVIADECKLCDQLCCGSATSCSAMCANATLPEFAAFLIGALFCTQRIWVLLRSGRPVFSSQLVIFYQLWVMFTVRSGRYAAIIWSDGSYQTYGVETLDRTLYWLALALLFSAFIVMTRVWTSILSRFADENGNFYFRSYHRRLRAVQIGIFVCCLGGGGAYGFIPQELYLLLSNVLPIFVFVPYVCYGAFKVHGEMKELKSALGGAGASRMDVVDRLGRIAYTASTCMVGAVVMVGIILVLILTQSDATFYCETTQLVMRLLELAVGGTLAWNLRGDKATSGSGSNTGTASTPKSGTETPSSPPAEPVAEPAAAPEEEG